jgi:hypothetical protein
MLIDLLGTLLFLASVVGALGVVIALLYGALTRQGRLIRVVLISAAVWLAVYSAMLIGASLLTPQRVLEPRQERCFDEMCFSVLQATTQPTVGDGEHTQAAHGRYYVVTVQLRNASQRTAQKPDHPAFFLDDGRGRHYLPSQAAQQALGQQPVWDARLQPGETQPRTLVVDAPANLLQQSPLPRLGITEGSWPTPLIIGDENSPWHRVTVMQLAFDPAVASPQQSLVTAHENPSPPHGQPQMTVGLGNPCVAFRTVLYHSIVHAYSAFLLLFSSIEFRFVPSHCCHFCCQSLHAVTARFLRTSP